MYKESVLIKRCLKKQKETFINVTLCVNSKQDFDHQSFIVLKKEVISIEISIKYIQLFRERLSEKMCMRQSRR